MSTGEQNAIRLRPIEPRRRADEGAEAEAEARSSRSTSRSPTPGPARSTSRSPSLGPRSSVSSRSRWARFQREARSPASGPATPPAAGREAVPQGGRRTGQVDAADGHARADRRGLQAQPDHPAQARRRGDRRCPTTGPMSFEMDVEVRPDFAAARVQGPEGQAARSRRSPSRTSTPSSSAFLERYAQIVPKLEGGAEIGDYLTADLTFHKRRAVAQRGQGDPVPAPARAAVPGRPRSPRSARPSRVPSPARSARPRPSSAPRSADPELRGQTIQVTFSVHDLKQLRLPEVNHGVPRRRSASTAVDELREAVRDVLERRLESPAAAGGPPPDPRRADRRRPRSTCPPTWSRARRRARSAGWSWSCGRKASRDNEIRAREAEIRANAHEIDPPLAQGVLHPGQDRRGRGASRSRTRTSSWRSRRSPRGPTRASAGSAPGSRRKGWPTRWRPRSSSARRSTASSSPSRSRTSPLDEPESSRRDLDQTATPAAATESPTPSERVGLPSLPSGLPAARVTRRHRLPSGRCHSRPAALPYDDHVPSARSTGDSI